jgi:phenylacetate-CoA ligase
MNSSRPISLTAPSVALSGLRRLIAEVGSANAFYRRKWANCPSVPESVDEFIASFPFTTKAELVADQTELPPYGSNLTYPVSHYVRCHQTSGTSGRPLRWLDTAESWAALREDWKEVLRQAGLRADDRVLFAFSFGPFLGFWLAFEAAQDLGAMCIPGGGMSTALRAKVLLENQCTVLCCTPTYALHLAEEGRAEGIDLDRAKVRLIVVAGEPGGSVPATRARLSEAWNGARVFDHHGMTEVGPVTFEDPEHPSALVVMEQSFFAEVINPATTAQLPEGETGELVLTTLRRTASPLVRYRTGDLVRAFRKGTRDSNSPETHSCRLILEGGIIGRVDDMVVIRGVNIYPGAIDEVVREVVGTVEYRVTVDTRSALPELIVEVESDQAAAYNLEARFKEVLALRVPVTAVASESLPRFEMKARRWRKL